MQSIWDKDFDQLFKDAFAEAEVAPSRDLWSNIESEIAPKKKRIIPIYWLSQKKMHLFFGMSREIDYHWDWQILEYDYNKTDKGVYKFRINPQYSNSCFSGDANFVADSITPLLADRLNVDTFTIDYFVHPTTNAILAQFKSVEHPDFTFIGAL